jgi:hypothetical protein
MERAGPPVRPPCPSAWYQLSHGEPGEDGHRLPEGLTRPCARLGPDVGRSSAQLTAQ